MKLVSVIIPCYKDSKTLCRAINSVVAQSYKLIEIIVINDCSPETEIIEKYLRNYPRIKYFYNKKNLGLAASRNKGIQLAKGEIVAFLDADDEYHPDKIKIQLEYLEENTVVQYLVDNDYSQKTEGSLFWSSFPEIKNEILRLDSTFDEFSIIISEKDLVVKS